VNADVKEKWLDALRRGEYSQTRKTLRDENGFCCLGVLCDIIDPSGWGQVRTRHGEKTTHLTAINVPSEAILAEAGIGEEEVVPGLESEDDEETCYVLTELMNLNDREHKSFEEIADWIEESL